MNSVWILWVSYDAEYPLPERRVLDGVYASVDSCFKRIEELKTDPYVLRYDYEEKKVIV